MMTSQKDTNILMCSPTYGTQKRSRAIALLTFASIMTVSTPFVAGAQDFSGDLDGFAGLGAQTGPTFSGSDEDETGVGVVLDLTWNDKFFISTERGAGLFVWSGGPLDEDGEPTLRLGAGAGYDFDERSSDDDDRLEGLDAVEASPTLNVVAEHELGPADVELNVSRASGRDGHEGTKLELSAGFDIPVGERTILTASPFVIWADENYTDALYGVSAAGSAASSFAQHERRYRTRWC